MTYLEKLLKEARAFNEKEQYKEVIELLTDDILNHYQNADLYAEKAQAYYRLEEKELCDKAVKKALLIDPLNAKANHYRGNLYWEAKEYINAIEAYNKAIEINPKLSYPYYGLGNVYRALKEYDKAIGAYNKAIEIDPKFSYPYNGLGNVYAELKEYNNAIKAYNKAIEIDTKYSYPYNGLGNVCADLKEYDKAIEAYSKAIEIDPIYDGPYFNIGLVYQETEAYEDALAAYEKFIELTNDREEYFKSLAQAKIKELKKLIKSGSYNEINESVNKIKEILLYKEACVTHYTGLSVAKVLILEKESLFRLSEGAFLNDTSEERELFKFLSFHQPMQKINDTVATSFTTKPFIGSFVAENKHDDLTLWRMYGKEKKEEAKGCALTLKREAFQKSIKEKLTADNKSGISDTDYEEFSFYRVAYRVQGTNVQADSFTVPGINKEDEIVLNQQMSNLQQNIKKFNESKNEPSDILDVQELLNSIAYLFKSIEFQYEHELRLVVKGIGFPKKVDTDSEPPRVYIELVKINPIIHKITLGPKVERADEWAAAFYYELDKEDHHPAILISHLPYK